MLNTALNYTLQAVEMPMRTMLLGLAKSLAMAVVGGKNGFLNLGSAKKLLLLVVVVLLIMACE